jgi:spermidine/putrescine transport system substrate-binding protein
VLAWPGMPASEALAEAGRRLGRPMSIETVVSNEALERRLGPTAEWDLVFPSDYLVERLAAAGDLFALEPDRLPVETIDDWALNAPHDPGCRWSVPFAYGTTGYLCRSRDAESWRALFEPRPGTRVGMLDEVREVVGAALIATGHHPNDVSDEALGEAREVLSRQRPNVAAYDSDNFVGPVISGAVDVHHAWSGPAAHAVRQHSELRYVVPTEGAILWITAAAIPAGAPDPAASLSLLATLTEPELAAQTTALNGFATPSARARRLLSEELRTDGALFPDEDILKRCHMLRDLGKNESRMAQAWPRARGDGRRSS